MSQDPLVYMPSKRWCELQSAFKKDWPRGRSGYAVLEMQKGWMDRGINYGFKVYCPFGEVQNGMVAVNEKHEFYEIIIQCPSDDTENLGAALRETKIIDWKRSIIVPFAPNNVIECIKKVLQHIDVEIEMSLLPSEPFLFDKKSIFEDLHLPPNITFGLLSMEHLEKVDSTWPHRYPTSPWYFQLLINTKCGYGLFLNGTLICWVFLNEAGTFLHMYTVEEQRKKGYAELLLKLVTNILLEDKKDVFAFSVKGNANACKLYKKAGFVITEGAAWCYLNTIKK